MRAMMKRMVDWGMSSRMSFEIDEIDIEREGVVEIDDDDDDVIFEKGVETCFVPAKDVAKDFARM